MVEEVGQQHGIVRAAEIDLESASRQHVIAVVDAGLASGMANQQINCERPLSLVARGVVVSLSELSGESHCLPACHPRKGEDRESMSEKSAARGSVTAILSRSRAAMTTRFCRSGLWARGERARVSIAPTAAIKSSSAPV